MVLTVSSALSSVIGLYCHRRLQGCLCKLERQRRGVRTTRLRRPQASALVKAPPASTASRANVRDDRETPLLWARDSQSIKLFLPNRKTKYFWRRGWTLKSRNSPPGKSVGSIEAGSTIPVVVINSPSVASEVAPLIRGWRTSRRCAGRCVWCRQYRTYRSMLLGLRRWLDFAQPKAILRRSRS
jgi:hypothetical protein